MSSPASKHVNITTATTTTITGAKVLRRVVVNTGVASATITVNDGDGTAIATIAADDPDIGRQYDVMVAGGSLSIVTDQATDVTVTYN